MASTQKTKGKDLNTESIGLTEMQINKGFEVANTWADANKIIAKMTSEQCIEMRDALKTTKRYIGLDMRADFILTLLESEVDARARGYGLNSRRSN